MPKQIIIAEQYRTAAVFSEDRIEEIIVATGTHQVGDIYMGVVENILVSIDAAFVNIGDGDRNGFIHITDLGPLKLRRSGGSISELLTPKQRVLVQVMKEPTGNKGPRLTGNISMPGRYVVLMPFGRGVSLSKRIKNEAERNRLRALGILTKPSGMGLLIRTEAEDMPEEMIIEDLGNLQKQWEAIQQEANTTRHPNLLNRDNDFIQKVLRDTYSDDVNRIVTDTNEGLKRVKQHLLSWADGNIPASIAIDLHKERTSILEYFRVNAAIRESLRPRVDLPSGGYIIIAPTEALTVIDVNSGSFTQSQTSRETVLWTNCEAAVEVARQLRLRNIAGVIVVDFIDMDNRRDQMQLLQEFTKALQSDKSRPQIAQLTELGLVELTRKRQGQSIYELFGRPCPTCNGLGHLVHLPGESALQSAEALPRDLRISTKLDLDASSDDTFSDLSGGTEANLISHPSYNDRNGSRRRRRSRDNERNGNDRNSTAIDQGRDQVRELVRESREKPKRSEPKELKLPAIPVVSEVEVDPVVEVISEKVKRAVPRPKLEAPELITVEMTTEEQEVYALMGISPLVLINREIKDTKSAIVSVALPGTVVRNTPMVEAPADLPETNIVSDSYTPKFEIEEAIAFNKSTDKPAKPTKTEKRILTESQSESETKFTPNLDLEPVDLEPIDVTDSVIQKPIEVVEENLENKPENDQEEIAEVKIQSPAASRRKRTRS
ncbi:ribonuclease, Rne/Rng family [Synechococcus sp. PCC 7502]|uniref:Rne/Rng family ribonuclease n=1 Tax=Synechococcus sp. PCC 7502 TaxID=1173263 RepID=UPI00029FCB49|nr:Rne/Rng family ribonuclease [Synechococcus sp. PCC 7502]AFY75019.1 ribonuclease, Rne/Rng family [Synechococcus sp. PCC 7502]